MDTFPEISAKERTGYPTGPPSPYERITVPKNGAWDDRLGPFDGARAILCMTKRTNVSKLSIGEKVLRCLQERAGEELTALQIGEWIVTNYPEEAEKKMAASKQQLTQASLPTQYSAEISSSRKSILDQYPNAHTTEGRPRRYYWAEGNQSNSVEGSTTPKTKQNRKEADLYPVLCEYLREDRDVHAIRIDEKRSSQAKGPGGNRWLYPDVVGMQFLSSGWEPGVRKLADQIRASVLRLWSLEVKLDIKRSNLRQYYFQAVSNSSWSNFGYVVAETIDSDAMPELEMLHSLHGIGLIQLNRAEPLESQVLVPARERVNVDWATCDRLAHENRDFRKFIDLVHDTHLTSNIRPELWR